MASNEYHFVTTWRIEATPEEVSAVLGDATALARWWPSVYLRVSEEQPGDATGVDKVVSLWTKGFLPYTLRWQFTVTESTPPNGFALRADGDFVGIGIWTLRAVPERQAASASGPAGAPLTDVTYDWTVLAEKGVLKRLSLVMKPVFGANHRWAMARGEESLRLELARRRAAGDPILSGAIPRPPGPTFPHNLRRPR
jgi:Polyketide cyclase / dehydrase and lipid transport